MCMCVHACARRMCFSVVIPCRTHQGVMYASQDDPQCTHVALRLRCVGEVQVGGGALLFDRARIEGLALACLCSTSEAVRLCALEVLSAASVLDGALLTCRGRAMGGLRLP